MRPLPLSLSLLNKKNSRKYRGHRVLPNDILDELDKANVI